MLPQIEEEKTAKSGHHYENCDKTYINVSDKKSQLFIWKRFCAPPMAIPAFVDFRLGLVNCGGSLPGPVVGI
jgi:hypothetical protein